MKTRNTPFRGNKAALPSKPCVACGLPMSWRRSWAKNWAEVKYCSEACRRAKSPHALVTPPDRRRQAGRRPLGF